ncbi:7676_t:CDS:1, partial [Dentiscutata erythropus]
MIISKIDEWIEALRTPFGYDRETEDPYFRNIREGFQNADKINIPIAEQKHPDHMYTSKPINTQEIMNTFSKMT